MENSVISTHMLLQRAPMTTSCYICLCYRDNSHYSHIGPCNHFCFLSGEAGYHYTAKNRLLHVCLLHVLLCDLLILCQKNLYIFKAAHILITSTTSSSEHAQQLPVEGQALHQHNVMLHLHSVHKFLYFFIGQEDIEQCSQKD